MSEIAARRATARQNSAKLYFCPRFHVNFYHSYRGDTPDERGFGKDIRIIRSILDNLDRLDAEGIRLRCAWDFDNSFTLGQILPNHAPDIIDRIKARVAAGTDEIELMSWNNGLLTAHTAEELEFALSWAISAPDGSGARQVFGGFAPVARPQECMFTSEHIDAYRRAGIEAVSLYYSAIPFNGFGSFVPRMPAWKRFNPLTLRNPRTGATMRLMPSINQGDIAEYFLSARRMLNAIRREQLADATPRDMLVVLDMDADDSFWYGMAPALSRPLLPSFGGLYSLMKSIARLSFVDFALPWGYLSTHPDVGELSLGQDIADGAFDGYASWAEKYENYTMWTAISQAREIWDEGKRLALRRYPEGAEGLQDPGAWMARLQPEIRQFAEAALAERLRALSTTHFGMAAPVMNVSRLEKAMGIAHSARTLAEKFRDAAASGIHGVDSPAPIEPGDVCGDSAPSCGIDMDEGGKVSVSRGAWRIEVGFPWVDYGGRLRKSSGIEFAREHGAEPSESALRIKGQIELAGRGGPRVVWERAFSMASGRFARTTFSLTYPATGHRGYSRAKALRLERTWDARWKQVAPLEIIAFRDLALGTRIHVWKEDFDGHMSGYTLDYAGYGGNSCLADINNHMTPRWVALSDGARGILVAQDAPEFRSYAFCPLRQRIHGDRQTVALYPFGALWGPQYRYPARVTGLGRLAATLTADHLFSSAPAWEGRAFEASILIGLYDGNSPPDSLLREMRACCRS